jgi:phasin family protein
MNPNILDSLQDQSTKLLTPSRELNKLFVAKLEQLTAMQFASLREYTDLNLSQLKAATEITTTEDLQSYFQKQQDFLKTLGEKLAADAQALVAISKEFSEEAQKIVLKGFAAVGGDRR